MAGLFPAEGEIIAHHILIYILIAHGSLLILKPRLVTGLIKPQVGHDRRHNGISVQASVLLHIFAADIEDQISVYHVAVFIYRDTSVRVAVIREAHIKLLLLHVILKHFDMRGTAVGIDIRSIRFTVDHIGLGAQRVIHALCDGKCASVGTVKPYPDILEGTGSQ